MSDVEALKNLIRQAFADVSYPGDGHLVAHANYGDEYALTKESFRGREDWQTLEWAFLEDAPDGWASALSFLTPAAFEFYLAAYLLADLDTPLQRTQPYFSLCFGITYADQAKPTNRKTRQEARLRGGHTKFEVRSQRFADFTSAQVDAVVAYLRHILQNREMSEGMRRRITDALQSYWLNAQANGSGIN